MHMNVRWTVGALCMDLREDKKDAEQSNFCNNQT